jgi:putative nucleotidyltransferase with HDIG domain
MTQTNGQEVIEVALLKVGMFVHLDGGWMSHPFPLSNFVITSTDQIARLRDLGLRRVRWSRQLSRSPETHESPTPGSAPAPEAGHGTSPSATTQRAMLAQQRQQLALCDQQFAETAQASRSIFDRAVDLPLAAGEEAGRLARALSAKMIDADEICIRLLTEDAGDKAAVHPVNVAVLALLLGRRFRFSEADMADLGVGALLHDIGKVDLPAHLHQPDERAPAAERKLYESHVAMGVARARRMSLSNAATLVIAQHHELADGTGFPRQIGGERITTLAQLVALANRYDNLCNPDRPSSAITPHEAMATLFAHGRGKFDPVVLETFIKMMGVYPPGSVVQLTDDRLAIVVSVNSLRPLKPQVLVYDRSTPAAEALHTDLEATQGLGIRRSLKPKALPREAHAYLAPRRRLNYFLEVGQALPA